MISVEPSGPGDTRREPLDPTSFRAAMARFPTGVTIVTTHDAQGQPYGFTASSFCSVSLEPPMVLVCIAKSANSYPTFEKCEQFAISILHSHHTELARRFASKRSDKFATGPFVRTASGLTVVDGALAVIECDLHQLHEVGDHAIMVGLAHGVRLASGNPAVYVNRSFGTVCPPASTPDGELSRSGAADS